MLPGMSWESLVVALVVLFVIERAVRFIYKRGFAAGETSMLRIWRECDRIAGCTCIPNALMPRQGCPLHGERRSAA